MELLDYMEQNPICVVCKKYVDGQPHHYITRGAGGKDEEENLERLCMKHHQEVHRIGIKQFTIKYKLAKPRIILINRLKWFDSDEEAYNDK